MTALTKSSVSQGRERILGKCHQRSAAPYHANLLLMRSVWSKSGQSRTGGAPIQQHTKQDWPNTCRAQPVKPGQALTRSCWQRGPCPTIQPGTTQPTLTCQPSDFQITPLALTFGKPWLRTFFMLGVVGPARLRPVAASRIDNCSGDAPSATKCSTLSKAASNCVLSRASAISSPAATARPQALGGTSLRKNRWKPCINASRMSSAVPVANRCNDSRPCVTWRLLSAQRNRISSRVPRLSKLRLMLSACEMTFCKCCRFAAARHHCMFLSLSLAATGTPLIRQGFP